MPDPATPPSNSEPREASSREPQDASNGEPHEVPEDQGAPADDAAPDVPVFANRAERRAKAKGKEKGRSSTQPQSSGRGQHPGGRGPVQSQRQWGNRRTG